MLEWPRILLFRPQGITASGSAANKDGGGACTDSVVTPLAAVAGSPASCVSGASSDQQLKPDNLHGRAAHCQGRRFTNRHPQDRSSAHLASHKSSVFLKIQIRTIERFWTPTILLASPARKHVEQLDIVEVTLGSMRMRGLSPSGTLCYVRGQTALRSRLGSVVHADCVTQ